MPRAAEPARYPCRRALGRTIRGQIYTSRGLPAAAAPKSGSCGAKSRCSRRVVPGSTVTAPCASPSLR